MTYWREAPLDEDNIALMRCTDCGGGLHRPRARALQCRACGACWPISDGLPRMFREESIQGTDRLLRLFYDGLPALHDPATTFLLPALQTDVGERTMRLRYRKHMALEALKPRADGQPVRILEVGLGCGADLPLLAEALPPDLDVEIWGVDISMGMLRQCRRRRLRPRRFRSSRTPRGDVRLALADAHALPFADGVFDRVFHIGAAGSWRDPARGLAEMARVARPGTPIVVVDEQLDDQAHNTLYHRLTFKLLTFYDKDPHCPEELLPPGATDIHSEPISRFYYSLRFTMPQQERAAA